MRKGLFRGLQEVEAGHTTVRATETRGKRGKAQERAKEERSGIHSPALWGKSNSETGFCASAGSEKEMWRRQRDRLLMPRRTSQVQFSPRSMTASSSTSRVMKVTCKITGEVTEDQKRTEGTVLSNGERALTNAVKSRRE